MQTNNSISHERLLEVVEYFPDTGIFINRIRRSNVCPIGKTLGTPNRTGHLVIQIDKEMYLAHRLAWFYCFKEWPENLIDHIDRNPNNNSIDNLREASKSTNSYNSNKRVTNTSGIKGAYYDKRRNKYYSQIVVKGLKTWLGYFNTVEEAGMAYNIAAKSLHGEFFNDNTILK